MPGWRRTPTTKVAIVIDTSGSIDDKLLGIFRKEILSILGVNGTQAYIMSCDAAVHQVIEPGEPCPESFVGGGGTDFRPAFELAKEKHVDGIIYLTDGYGTYPASEIIPTLWALTKGHQVPPWGQRIRVEE